MIEMDEHDPLERLTTYRPGRALLDSEWPPRDQADTRAKIMTSSTRVGVRWRARLPRLNPAAVSAVAIAAIIAGVVLVAVHSGRNPGRGGADRPLSFAAAQSTASVGNGQYARRAMTTYRVDAGGTATQTAQGTEWAAPDGALWMDGTLSAAGCAHFAAPSAGDFEQPTTAFFDQLPTTPGALESYMRAHTSGSSSQDEALFVATGDMLRDTDLLASAQLRAAAVSVLSGLSGVTVHTDATDYLDRPAIRLDWVNQALRPGEVSSLYFDPATYQLLEERDGPSGAPDNYAGPSPAYSAHESGSASTTDDLANPASLTVMTSEDVVDSVPADVLSCPAG